MTNVTDSGTLGGPDGVSDRRGRRRVALILVAIVAVLAVVLAGGSLAYAKQFDDRALPGTTVLGQDVAGKSAEEIADLVTTQAEGVTVTVTAGDQEHEASLSDLGVSVDAAATAQAAMGRDGSFTGVISSLWSGEHAVEPVVSVDDAATAAYAKSLIPEEKTQPVDAQVVFDEDESTWTAVPGTNGQGVDPAELVAAVSDNAASLQDFSVEQPVEELAPSITTEDAEETVGTIGALLEQPMTISSPEGDDVEVSAERRSSWIGVSPDESGEALQITVDEDAVRDWVAEQADDTAVEVKNGVEQIDDQGEVVSVVTEKKDGIEVTNTDAVADQLISSLKGTTPLEAAFETQKVSAEVEQVKAPAEDDEEASSDEDGASSDDEDATKDDEDGSSDDDATSNPSGEKWVDVNLSNKTTTAYIGDTPVWGPKSMVDGGEGYETVTGTFEVYLMYDKQDMTNASRYDEDDPEYYYTPDVPWVQYFHGGYAFHGAPWRSSFGYSGSHGCINLPVSDAKWLYDWAGMGTRVEVHY